MGKLRLGNLCRLNTHCRTVHMKLIVYEGGQRGQRHTEFPATSNPAELVPGGPPGGLSPNRLNLDRLLTLRWKFPHQPSSCFGQRPPAS